MRQNVLSLALSVPALVLSLEAASAFGARPAPAATFGLESGVTPVAMCGYTCRRGGRYIPGPPEVCYARGLEYCGSSRGGGFGAYGGGGYEGEYGGGGC